MSRVPDKLIAVAEDIALLKSWVTCKSIEARMIERANIILLAHSGLMNIRIASHLNIAPSTVGKWRKRYNEQGIIGLYDSARIGAPKRYPLEETRNAILNLLEQKPPKGQSVWDGKAIASALGLSKHQVWRILKAEGICLQRQRSWCVSTDPEFASKAAEVIGLYLNPPENAIVISIDEKPSIQAIERPGGYVQTLNGKIVRGMKSTYKRHGTLNLFAALEVATGAVHTKITQQKRRAEFLEFLEFMEQIVVELPESKSIHVIMDNYCIHKKNNEWLSKHKNVFFHYTPTSASWLHMVEIWFGILSRKALKGASFESSEKLSQAIQEFIDVYNMHSEPFVWRKREVRGSQLRNTIVNLRN